MIPLRQSSEDQGIDNRLIQEYERFLTGKAEGTIDAYVRTIRHVMTWVAHRPGSGGRFHPQQLTKTAVEVYLASLEQEGFSLNHRARVKSTISSFARWLIEEKRLLQRNPTRGVDLPSQQVLAPRQLSEDQRYILRLLVEQ
jgi:site-specific recombinase XerC